MILLEKIFFYLFVFCLPWQTRKILYTWGGEFNEWTSAYLYLTDVFIILLLLLWVWRLREGRFLENFKIFQLKNHSFWLMIFLFFSLITLVQARNLPLGFYSWLKLLEFILLFFYLKQNYNKIFNFKRLVQIFVASGVFQSLIVVGQFINQKSLGLRFLTESPLSAEIDGVAKFISNDLTFIRAYGSFPHPNVLAVFLLVCIFFVYYLWLVREKNFLGDCFLLSIYFLLLLALSLTFSRIIIFSFLLLSLIFFILNFKKYKKQIFGLFLVLVIFSSIFFLLAKPEAVDRFQISSGEQSVVLREFYNQVSYSIVQEYPLIGIGLGNFVWEIKEIMHLMLSWIHQPVHNIYLLIASEVGLTGLLFFLMFVYQLLIGNRKQKIKNKEERYLLILLVFCFLFLGLFDHFFWTLQQGQLIFWLILGLLGANIFHNLTADERGV